jgi:phosphoenolpyruvate synthase/pyruvate phosphate dikinase
MSHKKGKDIEEEIWTRVFGDDYSSGVMSPLFFSWLRELIGPEKVKYYKGYLYVPVSFMRELLQPENYPSYSRTYIMKHYFPDFMQDEIDNLPYKWYRKLLFTLVIALRHPNLLESRTSKAYRKFENKYKFYLNEFDKKFLKADTVEKLIQMDKEFDKHFMLHWLLAFGGGIHCVINTSILKGLIDKWFENESLYDKLFLTCSNRTSETNIAVYRLAEEVKKDKNLSALFTKSSDIIQKNIPKYPSFYKNFSLFIENFGHRSFYRDFAYPRWKDDSSLIIENIKQIALSQKNYDEDKKENRLRQKKAEEEFMNVPFWRRRLFKKRLYYARTYIRFREDQRFVLDLHLTRKRSLYLKMGEILVEKGILAGDEDIFYIDIANIEELSHGKLTDVKEKVRQARMKLELHKRSMPAMFLRGDNEFERKLSIKEFFEGTAASAGKVTSVARIVKTIDDIGILKANDILVTRFTDPGWTPCFHMISGLVTEIGGLVSHGAIIAREYGIPAVTGVNKACENIMSGDILTVDGNGGRVYKHEKLK